MNELAFWKLDTLSDRQLLEGLGAVLGSGRRLTAQLVAHLGEVEDRRLHLEAACSSMFSYCVNRLGLSEGEACRRIEVARLARRHPAMFPLLASGQLSLSVAALLKPHLSAHHRPNPRGPLNRLDPIQASAALDPFAASNVSAAFAASNVSAALDSFDPFDPLDPSAPLDPLDLLAAVSGKSVQQAREVLAARFPRPDVPSSVRKLPERRVAPPRVRLVVGAGNVELGERTLVPGGAVRLGGTRLADWLSQLPDPIDT